MLYLVEYANWDSQTMIGYGCGNNSSIENNGASDSMPYHTGTMTTSRTAYGVGIQYRYIENWWANVRTWIDGIYFSSANAYGINNPALFSDNTGGISIGNRATNSGFISSWNNPTANGYEYALLPSGVSGNSSTYVTDYNNYWYTGQVLDNGGAFDNVQYYGIFCNNNDRTASNTDPVIGCRLIVLPSSRIS